MTHSELMSKAYSLLAELATHRPETKEHRELRKQYYLLTVIYAVLNENTDSLFVQERYAV